MFPYVQFYKMATNPKLKSWGTVYLYLSLQKYGSQTITIWKTNRKGNCQATPKTILEKKSVISQIY